MNLCFARSVRHRTARCCWSRAAMVLAVGLFCVSASNAQTIGNALDQAWSRNPQATTFTARESEAQARADVAAGLTPGPPSMSLSSLNDRLNTNLGRQEWEVEVVLPLWLPGQRGARGLEAESAGEQVAARRTALRLQIAGEVREAWWALALARQAENLTKRREAAARTLEADVLRRYKAGELARVDANLAQSEKLAAEGDLLEARSALRQAEQTYRLLTGVDAPVVLIEENLAPTQEIAVLHPQLAAAQAAARLAQARWSVAQQSRRDAPELALRVVRDRGDFSAPYTNSLGVKLTLPFSSGARVRQESSAAQTEASQADAELALAQQRVEIDTARARLALEVAQQQLSKAQERSALTTDTLRLAEKSFALGESDLPALLRARSAAFEAEAYLNRQKTARAADVSRLKQSLGELP